jgi:hypothetical protein
MEKITTPADVHRANAAFMDGILIEPGAHVFARRHHGPNKGDWMCGKLRNGTEDGGFVEFEDGEVEGLEWGDITALVRGVSVPTVATAE